jgi:hypothetical protein
VLTGVFNLDLVGARPENDTYVHLGGSAL